ncbi:hypothetical protein SHKM778_50350 [Streptomyces sp. KM77-8]|uniref:GAF domain-containing protein n=1 Tax=Streptomyces haneummycinicus TaxID=3074435 RepID=A0AAT9HMH3_9ACTN
MALVVPRLADWAVVDLITERDEVWRAVVVHADGETPVRHEELEGPMPPIPEESPMPLSRALRGVASTLAGPQTYQGIPDSGIAVEQGRLFRATAMHSAAIAPIRSPRAVLGALTLGRAENPEPFAPVDLPLIEDVARRAGLALDNARLYQRQRKVAETMQNHLLPQMPGVSGLEMNVRYLPAPDASHVGGDWYDAFPWPTPPPPWRSGTSSATTWRRRPAWRRCATCSVPTPGPSTNLRAVSSNGSTRRSCTSPTSPWPP